MNPSVAAVLQFFRFEHLPPHLQAISKPFAVQAASLATALHAGPETVLALRALLTSKDHAVRAGLAVEHPADVEAWARGLLAGCSGEA